MNERLCCFIPDQSRPETSRCPHLAEYEIWAGDEPTPDDFTDSCGIHLAEMMDDRQRFEILRIQTPDKLTVDDWTNGVNAKFKLPVKAQQPTPAQTGER